MKIFFRTLRLLLLLGIASFILHQSAVACPYCYGTGAAESSMTDSLKMAIGSLVGVTGTVLAACAFFFLRLMRKSSREVENSEHSWNLRVKELIKHE